jgi:uncharacterized membrane protein
MSGRDFAFVRGGLLASGAAVALVLLMLFHATVSGAVDRAARQRHDAAAARAGATADGAAAGRLLTASSVRRP